MKVVGCRVVGRSAGNGRPVSGDVRFDDGKFYEWLAVNGEISFFGVRKIYDAWRRFSFQSPARAEALADHLEIPYEAAARQNAGEPEPAPGPAFR